jgi:hypothetical protein
MPALRNPRHEQFSQLVASGKTLTESYISVGYSANGAIQSASKLLRTPKVKARIEDIQVAVSQAAITRSDLTTEYILNGIKTVAERCLQAVPVLDSLGKETGVWRFDSAGANKAFELLGRTKGLFVDRHEHAGVNGGPIQVQSALLHMSANDLQQMREILSRSQPAQLPPGEPDSHV